MKYARKALIIAALAFGAAALAPAAAQASPHSDWPTNIYKCSVGGDQASAYNIGLLNGNNVQVPISNDLNVVGTGLGILGIGSGVGSVSGC